MKASISAKRCPKCGKVTALHALGCLDCGHQFRTRFAEPAERTQAFDAVMLPRPPAASPRPTAPPHPHVVRHSHKSGSMLAFAVAFAASFCLVALVGLVVWVAFSLSHSPGVSTAHPAPAAFAGTLQTGRAEELYERIAISMSLYDLDQVAGGMGKIIHGSDPHALLLTYDFPDQSVRVSLYRTDVTSDDYRVEAVGLYHGNTLQRRHADN